MALVGCTTAPGPADFRNQGVNITSSIRFDAAKFAGDWYLIETFAVSGEIVEPVVMSFRKDLKGQISYAEASFAQRGKPKQWLALNDDGQGRLSIPGAPKTADPIWVLWVDEDFRTAVLGTPSGKFGHIINRSPNLRRDRLKAAREVLSFNGYDTKFLVGVGP